MRQAIIKEVQELSNEEVELLLENDVLQNEIMEYTIECESLYIDDMLQYIEPYLSDYSIAAYNYSYMKVADVTGFLYGVLKLQDDYCILNDKDVKVLYNAIESADIYCSLDIGTDEYIDAMNDVKSYVKVISNYLVNEFVEILEYYGTFDRIYHESDYVNNYLENIYDNECLIDGNKVTLI